jgi:hypothetical protein
MCTNPAAWSAALEVCKQCVETNKSKGIPTRCLLGGNALYAQGTWATWVRASSALYCPQISTAQPSARPESVRVEGLGLTREAPGAVLKSLAHLRRGGWLCLEIPSSLISQAGESPGTWRISTCTTLLTALYPVVGKDGWPSVNHPWKAGAKENTGTQ